jgi:hypothetical protein
LNDFLSFYYIKLKKRIALFGYPNDYKIASLLSTSKLGEALPNAQFTIQGFLDAPLCTPCLKSYDRTIFVLGNALMDILKFLYNSSLM